MAAGALEPSTDVLHDPSIPYRASLQPAPPQHALFVTDNGAWTSDPSSDPGSFVSSNDLRQGPIGDCYFLSSLGALAETDPDHFNKHIKDNGDGTYTVTFYRRQELPRSMNAGPGSARQYQYVPETVTVSIDDIPKDQYGNPANVGYGDVNTQTGTKEVWPMVYEAAYAKWKGGYRNIGNGGPPGPTMGELTGKPSQTHSVSSQSPDDLRKRIADGQAVTLSTNAPAGDGVAGWIRNSLGANDNDILYRNGTLVSDHAYVVKGVTQNDEVILVNPHDGREVVIPYKDLERACSYGKFAYNGGSIRA